MTKQSAMMQLKEKLQLEIENITKCVNQDEHLKGYKTAFENIVKDIDAQMLEMEKQNIIDAYLDARLEGEFKEPTDGEDYYNQTFNQ
jgi:HEPN domain-containing protein